jgi:hypothetical protein
LSPTLISASLGSSAGRRQPSLIQLGEQITMVGGAVESAVGP